jgi:hypothetical protein
MKPARTNFWMTGWFPVQRPSRPHLHDFLERWFGTLAPFFALPKGWVTSRLAAAIAPLNLQGRQDSARLSLMAATIARSAPSCRPL